MPLSMNRAIEAVQPSAIRVFSRMARETPGCIALTLGEPDFDTPESIRQAAHAALESGQTHYIENNGAMALRNAIADFERGRYQMDYAPEEIIVTSGATEALFATLFAILNPDDEVIVPVPAFGLYQSIVQMCRGRFVPLPTYAEQGYQIDCNALKARITPRTKAILLNSPNNPTGCVYSVETLNALRKCLKDQPIFIVCDDVYRQLYYGQPPHSFSEFREFRNRLVVVQSFSKPYAMTGWRLGYLMADHPVVRQIEKVHQDSVVSTAAFSQDAGIEALRCDPVPMRETYKFRRDYALMRLRDMALPTPTPDGAFYCFPSIEAFRMDSTAFCTRMLREAGLAATPGACFGDDGHIRLTYCYDMEHLQKGFDRLEQFVMSLRNGA